MLAVRLVEETPGGKALRETPMLLRSTRDVMSVRVLLERQIEAFRRQSAAQPAEEGTSLPGPRLIDGRLGSPSQEQTQEAQVEEACRAFAGGQLLVLLDGRQLGALDQTVALRKESDIRFVLLQPLVGG